MLKMVKLLTLNYLLGTKTARNAAVKRTFTKHLVDVIMVLLRDKLLSLPYI